MSGSRPPPPPAKQPFNEAAAALQAGFSYAPSYERLHQQGLVPVVLPGASASSAGRLVTSAVKARKSLLAASPFKAQRQPPLSSSVALRGEGSPGKRSHAASRAEAAASSELDTSSSSIAGATSPPKAARPSCAGDDGDDFDYDALDDIDVERAVASQRVLEELRSPRAQRLSFGGGNSINFFTGALDGGITDSELMGLELDFPPAPAPPPPPVTTSTSAGPGATTHVAANGDVPLPHSAAATAVSTALNPLHDNVSAGTSNQQQMQGGACAMDNEDDASDIERGASTSDDDDDEEEGTDTDDGSDSGDTEVNSDCEAIAEGEQEQQNEEEAEGDNDGEDDEDEREAKLFDFDDSLWDSSASSASAAKPAVMGSVRAGVSSSSTAAGPNSLFDWWMVDDEKTVGLEAQRLQTTSAAGVASSSSAASSSSSSASFTPLPKQQQPQPSRASFSVSSSNSLSRSGGAITASPAVASSSSSVTHTAGNGLGIQEQNRLVRAIAKANYGHASLRPGQGSSVQAALQGRDALVVLPTGSGKTLGYLLPALVQPGLAVVISPLIALMHDQVSQARQHGVPAAMMVSEGDNAATAQVQAQLHAMKQLDPRKCVPIPPPASLSASGSFFAPSASPSSSSSSASGRYRWTEPIKVLYVTPERMCGSASLCNVLWDLHGKGLLSRFVVDEAHCVVEWAGDFRKEYGQLGMLRQAFPGVPVTAMTATATPAMQEQIAHTLGIVFSPPQQPAAAVSTPASSTKASVAAAHNAGAAAAGGRPLASLPPPPSPAAASNSSSSSASTAASVTATAAAAAARVVLSFDRPNLFFEARRVGSSWRALGAELLAFVASRPGTSGVVYVPSRAGCERLCALLNQRLSYDTATFYHAKLGDAAERAARQQMWMDGRVRVMVATAAFGLGVSKGDVRWVVHAGLPKSLSAYQQEAGRAGRDGKPAHCLLLWCPPDVHAHETQMRNSNYAARAEVMAEQQARAATSAAALGGSSGGGHARNQALKVLACRVEVGVLKPGMPSSFVPPTQTERAANSRALADLLATKAEPPSAGQLRLARSLAANLQALADVAKWACEQTACRRAALLQHFGEKPGRSAPIPAPACCDNCRYAHAVAHACCAGANASAAEGVADAASSTAAAASAVASSAPIAFAFPRKLRQLLDCAVQPAVVGSGSGAAEVGASSSPSGAVVAGSSVELPPSKRFLVKTCGPTASLTLDLTPHACLAIRAVEGFAKGVFDHMIEQAAQQQQCGKGGGGGRRKVAAPAAAPAGSAFDPPAEEPATPRALGPGRDGFTVAQLVALLAAATAQQGAVQRKEVAVAAADDAIDGAYDAMTSGAAAASAASAVPFPRSAFEMEEEEENGGAFVGMLAEAAASSAPPAAATSYSTSAAPPAPLLPPSIAGSGPLPFPLPKALWTRLLEALVQRGFLWERLVMNAAQYTNARLQLGREGQWRQVLEGVAPFHLTLRPADLGGKLVVPVPATAASAPSAGNDAAAIKEEAVPTSDCCSLASGTSAPAQPVPSPPSGHLQPLEAAGVPWLPANSVYSVRKVKAARDDGGDDGDGKKRKKKGKRGRKGRQSSTAPAIPLSPTPAVYLVEKVVQPEKTFSTVSSSSSGGGVSAKVFPLFNRAAMVAAAAEHKAAGSSGEAAGSIGEAAGGGGGKKGRRKSATGASTGASAKAKMSAVASAKASVSSSSEAATPVKELPPPQDPASIASAAFVAATSASSSSSAAGSAPEPAPAVQAPQPPVAAAAPAAAGQPRCKHGNGPDCAACEEVCRRVLGLPAGGRGR